MTKCACQIGGDFPAFHHLFSALTVQFSHSSYRDPADVPWLLGDQVSSWEGSNIQRAWSLLRAALEKHDSLENGWAYRKAVFARILDLDRLSRVPTWLIKFFEDEEPEYLIRSSLKYGLVEQSLQYCLSMVRKVCCRIFSSMSSLLLPGCLLTNMVIEYWA